MVKRICVLGNFSGRNSGDAAILGGLLKDITTAFGRLQFEVPTINPAFIRRQYSDYDVRPCSLLPWNLSVKIFGLPVVRSILRSDVVIVTDAILFDRKLFNPLFNYLSTMALVLPMARSHGIPVILYNVNLGPVRSRAGRACLRRVLNAANEIILRDTESLQEIPPDLAAELNSRIARGADCALSIDPASDAAVDAIVALEDLSPARRPFFTFNVNSYIDVFVHERGARTGLKEFARLMSSAANELLKRLDANMVVVVTQPMDMHLTQAVLRGIEQPSRVRLITNSQYSYEEIAGVLSRARMHIGMRTHSLILATSCFTPVVGIIATPKNRGYMRSIEQDERMIEFDELTPDHLVDKAIDTWTNHDEIRRQLQPIIDREKARAVQSTERLGPYLDGVGERGGKSTFAKA